jgi:hypothetical protein
MDILIGLHILDIICTSLSGSATFVCCIFALFATKQNSDSCKYMPVFLMLSVIVDSLYIISICIRFIYQNRMNMTKNITSFVLFFISIWAITFYFGNNNCQHSMPFLWQFVICQNCISWCYMYGLIIWCRSKCIELRNQENIHIDSIDSDRVVETSAHIIDENNLVNAEIDLSTDSKIYHTDMVNAKICNSINDII